MKAYWIALYKSIDSQENIKKYILKLSEQRKKQTPKKLLVKREVSASNLHWKPM